MVFMNNLKNGFKILLVVTIIEPIVQVINAKRANIPTPVSTVLCLYFICSFFIVSITRLRWYNIL